MHTNNDTDTQPKKETYRYRTGDPPVAIAQKVDDNVPGRSFSLSRWLVFWDLFCICFFFFFASPRYLAIYTALPCRPFSWYGGGGGDLRCSVGYPLGGHEAKQKGATGKGLRAPFGFTRFFVCFYFCWVLVLLPFRVSAVGRCRRDSRSVVGWSCARQGGSGWLRRMWFLFFFCVCFVQGWLGPLPPRRCSPRSNHSSRPRGCTFNRAWS